MTAIDESQTAKGFTPGHLVQQVFGRKRTIDQIVIHHWGSSGQTHEGVVNFFVNGPGTTSAHFVVSAGKITCLVSPADAAWHTGSAAGNATTIGIECRPEASAADYATTAELVRFLRDEYGALPLSAHRDWSPTACPGVWDLKRIDQLAAATMTVSTQSTTVKESPVAEVWKTKITEYQQDGSTPKPGKPWKSAAFILGQFDQYITRVLAGQAAIRKDIADLRKALGK